MKRTVSESALSAALAFLLSLIVLGEHLGQLGTAWASGDMLSTYVNAVNWDWFQYGTTTDFGFPDGMTLAYFPGVDITQNLFAQVVNLITGNPFMGINVLLVLSFPLVAAMAYFAIRLVGLRGPLAIALAACYSLIPYHWGRALGHFYLATMYAGVTALLLALLIGTGTLQRRYTTGSHRQRIWIGIAIAVLVITSALSGIYYAAFTLILGAAALMWRIYKRDRWKRVLLSAIPYAAVMGLVILGLLPSILTLKAEPPLASLGQRMPIESVLFAGNLAMAILPLPLSTLPGMQHYNDRVQAGINATPNAHLENVALTNYGTWVTLAALIVFLLGLVFLPKVKRTASPLSFITYLTVVTVLFFVPWGLNYLFASALTPQIRAWNRLLPLLLLLFILGAAAVLARVDVKGTPLTKRPWIIWPVIVIALTLTIADSVIPFRAPYDDAITRTSARVESAKAYATAVNAAIPGKCGILQLPYMAYPENGPITKQGNGVNDYDHFFTSVMNREKQWSYGAVKNTKQSQWLASLPWMIMDKQIAELRQRGFCGIHIDTGGFTPEKTQKLTGFLDVFLGKPVTSGDDGAWLMYSLR